MNQQKIRMLSEITPIEESLKYAMVLIGLRAQNWPSPEEKGLLINFIIKNYGGHTPAEIKLAFDMAVAGRLEAEVNCFENFSVFYFASIMNSYRKWASEAHRFAISPEKQILIPEVQTTDEEFLGAVKALYLHHKDFQVIPVMAYDVLNLGLSTGRKKEDQGGG
jgi:hypothetical protein